MPASPSMYVTALRHEDVFRYAGSYDMRPPSPSDVLIWRRSVARIVPSTIGSEYSRPVRLSATVSVSSATTGNLAASAPQRLRGAAPLPVEVVRDDPVPARLR